MEYKQYNGFGLSRLGYGAMRLPEKDGRIDREVASTLIDKAIKGGVTYIDTAVVYHAGDSEVFLGEVLKNYSRDSYCLASKFTINASPDYKKMFEEQLQRLGTDYLDFYLMHGIGDSTAQRYIDEGAVDYFLEQKRKGRIRFLGFSTHASPEVLKKFVSHHQWDFAQMQLNYFDWNFSHTEEEYNILRDNNIPIVVMEPVRGGRLADLTPEANAMLKKAHPEWSIASWAFRFVRSLPQVQVILSGMTTLNQVEDNLATFSSDNNFTEKDREILFEAARLFRSQVHIPCTSCRYCCETCPSEINIPEWLKLYNRSKIDGGWVIKRFGDAVESKGVPADCVACRECIKQCPQGIDIPSLLEELTDALR